MLKSNLFYFGVFIITLSVALISVTLSSPSWSLKLDSENNPVYAWGIIFSFSIGVAATALAIAVLIGKRQKKIKITKPELEYDPN